MSSAGNNVRDLELRKFRRDSDGEIFVAVSSKQGPLSGVKWDAHLKTVTDEVVTYTFYRGGLSGELLATAVLTYDSAHLCELISSEWSYT